MAYTKRILQILGLGAAMLLAVGAHAADYSDGKSKTGSNGAATTSTATSGAASNGAATTKSATVSEKDQKFMKDMADGNLAEIQTGKLALEKSSNPDIKQFAQMMIDDHTKANNELQKMAQSKGVTLPQEADMLKRAETKGMSALSGNTFDKAYINLIGRSDHKNDVKLLQKAQNEAQDPDLRAYAQKTLQTVNQHLQQATAIQSKMKSKGDTTK